MIDRRESRFDAFQTDFHRCASSTLYGSSEIFSVAHSQNEAISEALVVDNFESTKPASMIGIKAAAARRRFISGVGGGTGVIFAIGTFYQ